MLTDEQLHAIMPAASPLRRDALLPFLQAAIADQNPALAFLDGDLEPAPGEAGHLCPLLAENAARVVDRQGATLGLATLEDVIEELVGEIRDAAHLEDTA